MWLGKSKQSGKNSHFVYILSSHSLVFPLLSASAKSKQINNNNNIFMMYFVMQFSAVIRIGFERQSYNITEPNPDDEDLIHNFVYLIRENNRTSEQTYSVDLTVGDPGGNNKPATILTSNTYQNFDYSLVGSSGLTKLNVLFQPTVDRIAFVFSLNQDLAVEETETFRATSAQVTPSGDFPVFQTPSDVNAFATTLIHILDNDGKYQLCMYRYCN